MKRWSFDARNGGSLEPPFQEMDNKQAWTDHSDDALYTSIGLRSRLARNGLVRLPCFATRVGCRSLSCVLGESLRRRELRGARDWQDYAAALRSDQAPSLLPEASINQSDVSLIDQLNTYS